MRLNPATQDQSWSELFNRALRAAVEQLQELQGDDPAAWTWAGLHRHHFLHNPGREAPGDAIFNLPDVGIGGDGTTVFAAAVDPRNFKAPSGVSYRMPAAWARSSRASTALSDSRLAARVTPRKPASEALLAPARRRAGQGLVPRVAVGEARRQGRRRHDRDRLAPPDGIAPGATRRDQQIGGDVDGLGVAANYASA